MQKLALLVGALILLAATFYIGKKFEYWRYVIATRNEAKIAAKVTGDFAGASAEELIEHAVIDEQAGRWDDAAKRLIAAKYKNVALGGILFHAANFITIIPISIQPTVCSRARSVSAKTWTRPTIIEE